MNLKEDTLKKNRCFNENHERVSAMIFKSNVFFDSKDIIQVKYEMVRAASKNESNITKIADEFGFSRKSFYQINEAFNAGGLCALIPKKPGPKKPSKLNEEILGFIDLYMVEHKNAKPSEVSSAIETEKGLKVHPRTISRYLEKKNS